MILIWLSRPLFFEMNKNYARMREHFTQVVSEKCEKQLLVQSIPKTYHPTKNQLRNVITCNEEILN
jgi:hypothetical protein